MRACVRALISRFLLPAHVQLFAHPHNGACNNPARAMPHAPPAPPMRSCTLVFSFQKGLLSGKRSQGEWKGPAHLRGVLLVHARPDLLRHHFLLAVALALAGGGPHHILVADDLRIACSAICGGQAAGGGAAAGSAAKVELQRNKSTAPCVHTSGQLSEKCLLECIGYHLAADVLEQLHCTRLPTTLRRATKALAQM